MNDNTTHAWVQETQFGPIGIKETGGAIVRVYLPDEIVEKGTCRGGPPFWRKRFSSFRSISTGFVPTSICRLFRKGLRSCAPSGAC